MAKQLSSLYVVIGAKTQEFTRAMDDTQKQLAGIGAAMTAVGAAGLKLSADARKLNAELGQTALTIGVSTKEMRDLALTTTDVTFQLESVAATFDLLARAGMRNTDEIQKAAKAFDALGDATGTSAEFVADLLIPAFKLFGEAIPTTSQELDRFTWLVKTTNVDLSDFGTLLTRMAPYMSQLNMSMDDAVATLAALSDQGIQGTAATLKLRTAITQAASSGESLNDILGITQDQLNNYKQQMRGATGITNDYAKVANSQFGVMDKLKQKWSELTFQMGSFLTPLEPVLAAMTALGPVMMTIALKGKALMAFFTALKVKMLAVQIQAVAMWSAITLGVAAAIIGIVELIRNWDNVVAFFKGPAYQAARQVEQAMKDLGESMLDTLDGAIKEVTTSYENFITLLRTGQFEQVGFLNEKQFALIEEVNPELAAQLRSLQQQAEAQGAIAKGIEDQIQAQAIANRLAEIAVLLPEAEGEERQKLLAEQSRLQEQIYKTEYQGLLAEWAPTIANALQDQLNEWQTHWKDIQDGWDGTLAYVRDVIMPAMQDAIAKGILPPEALQETIAKATAEAAPGEPTREPPRWQQALIPIPALGLLSALGEQAQFRGQQQAFEEWQDVARELKEAAKDISEAAEKLPTASGVPMQHGGIVTSPTMALIGERGPEAVIPLDRLEGGSGEVHIHVGNLIGDEMSMRKFVRTVGEMLGQEGRRNFFGQVNKTYGWGTSST